jgi:hypothetical protein
VTTCGDQTAAGAEACDSPDLRGQTCPLLGFLGGVLACNSDCSFNTSGCSLPEVCKNAADDDKDGLYDCGDPDCAADPACNLPPEVTCNNLLDEDSDGLFDCQDPTDCQTLPTCAPGAAPTGAPCSSSSDCQANALDPFCLDSQQFNWPLGSCSEFCNLASNDCAGDAICHDFDLGTSSGLCLDGCSVNADCRPGYGCLNLSGGGFACYPTIETCDNGVDDNNDGAIDCAAPECAGDASCAVCGDGILGGDEQCDPPDGVTCNSTCLFILPPEDSCGNLIDEDSDGLYDCQDPDCQALASCQPGSGLTGAPCTSPSDCQTDALDPFCIDQAQFAWPDGACSEFCDLAMNDCSGDAVCADVALGTTSGLCIDGCVADADCRPGYACKDIGVGGLVCYPD